METAPTRRKFSKKERRESIIFQNVLYILFVASLVYGVIYRSLHDFLVYPLYILAVISIMVFAIYFRESAVKGYPKEHFTLSNLTSVAAGTAIGGWLCSILFYCIGVCFKDFSIWISTPSLKTNGSVAFTVVLTLLLGMLLFHYRLRYRSIYGLTEALVGLFVAGNRAVTDAATGASKPAFYIALLTAGVYLVVRGFDNIHQGLTKEPKDNLALQGLAYIREKVGWDVEEEEEKEKVESEVE